MPVRSRCRFLRRPIGIRTALYISGCTSEYQESEISGMDGEGNICGETWTDVDFTKDVIYASLIGVGIFGLKIDSTMRFSLPYEHMFVDCKQYTRASNDEKLVFFLTFPKFDIVASGWPQEQRGIFSRPLRAGTETVHTESSFFLVRINRSSKHPPNNVYYGSRDIIRTNTAGPAIQCVALYECSRKSLLVEARIECISDNCKVYQMRRSPV
jgi:hypothetical protein